MAAFTSYRMDLATVTLEKKVFNCSGEHHETNSNEIHNEDKTLKYVSMYYMYICKDVLLCMLLPLLVIALGNYIVRSHS